MLLGPVFRAELVRTPRRGRYYSLRVIYGSVLILLLWANYQDLNGVAPSRRGQPSIAEVSNFALMTFIWFRLRAARHDPAAHPGGNRRRDC
jgi:hypothetical protein